jgi:hypothetical protein
LNGDSPSTFHRHADLQEGTLIDYPYNVQCIQLDRQEANVVLSSDEQEVGLV